MRKNISVLAVTVLIALFFLGCAKEQSPEEYAVKLAVTKYNNAIIDLYRTVSPEKLNEIALAEESRKVQSYMSIFLPGKRLMDAEYNKIDFDEVTIDGESAFALTSEDWRFRWVHFKTGKEIEPWKDIHYNMRYDLTLVEGKWMIEKATDMDKEEADLKKESSGEEAAEDVAMPEKTEEAST